MPPVDAPLDEGFDHETIHYTITAHGTLQVTKDPKKNKPHKHKRRHRKKRDSHGREEPENEGTETGLHAHMTLGPLHASTTTSNTPKPVSHQHAHTTAMHKPEPGAAPPERAAHQATSKQGTYRRPRVGTIFPMLS